MVMVVMFAFSILAIGLFKLHETDAVETVYVDQSARAFWLAETGIQSTLTKLRRSGKDGTDYRASVSTDENNPTIESGTLSNGTYSVQVWSDGSTSNFYMESRGTVMAQERLLRLDVALNPFGPHGLVTLNGDSSIRDGAIINGSVYQNGKLTTRGDVDITGDVLADNYEDFPNGVPIPEDGYIEMSIDTDYFDPYLAMSATTNASSITNTLDLMDQTVVVDSSIDPSFITSTGGTNGVLVVLNDQTFSKDLTIGDNVTIVVDGDLKISKNATFGDNVTLFATGELDLFKQATAEVVTGEGCSFFSLQDAKVWKEFSFDGLFFTEGTFTAEKSLDVTGTIVTEEGFRIKKDATITFDQGVIPEKAYNEMITISFIVSQSSWDERPIP